MGFDTGHALVIGIGEYPKALRLNTAQITALDAEVVAKVLKAPALCGYPEAQVRLLNKAQATRDTILAELDRLAQVTKEGDTLFLFYSGHGEYGEDGHFYLTTYDTELNDDLKVRTDKGVREQQLLDKIKSIKATRALLIFNACHAGAIRPMTLGGAEPETTDTGTGQNLPDQLTTALLGAGEGRVIITACRDTQRSHFIPTDPATLFAQSLTDGLQGTGFVSHKNTISLFDLYEYVFTTVSEKAKTWAVVQEPVLTISQGVGIMPVALYQGKQQPAVLGVDDEEPAPDLSKLRGQVKAVKPEDSKKEFDNIMKGKINVAAQRDVKDNVFIAGDQRNINTGGGDYAEGDIDKRKGIFGGEFHGPAIGSAENSTFTFTSSPVSAPSAAAAGGVTLQMIQAQFPQLVAQARAHGNDDLADDLAAVATSLEQASRAQGENKTERYQSRLTEARTKLADIIKQEPMLGTLGMLLEQIG